MLHRFLVTIQAGNVQSLLEIARKLGLSANKILRMAKKLTDKGYLQEIGADCAVNRACQSFVRHWFLTENGRRAVSSSSLAK
jgi:DNA-binding Lrp family transcriptional regulator